MDGALDTLFLPLAQGLSVSGFAAFYNAQAHAALETFRGQIYLQQHFKPYAAALSAQGFECFPEISDKKVATVFVLLPKNIAEARYFIARALNNLEEGGIIITAAANDAGGGRIKKMLQGFGLSQIFDLSKNKARVAWAEKIDVNSAAVAAAIKEGGMQDVMDGAFRSMPGLFSWDRADEGSQLLAANLPAGMKGRGADFGCGYGFLAREVLARGAEHLTCIDADARAIEAARENLKGANVSFAWMDLTSEAPEAFDWIVMNPPFHEGKKMDAGVGKAFIATAAQSLKAGGSLWMAANAQLPYEEELRARFGAVTAIKETGGFKIYQAQKD